jgi:hypothetical protein
MERQLFVQSGGVTYGPYLFSQVQLAACQGLILPQQFLSYDGINWFVAGAIWEQLVGFVAAPPVLNANLPQTFSSPSSYSIDVQQLSRSNNPKPSSASNPIVSGCAAIFIFAMLLASIRSCGGGAADTTDRKTEAWVMAQQFVKDYLKSPRTADFGGFSDFQSPDRCVTELANGEYVVSGWVDAQNGFGAVVRSNFVVKLRKSSDAKTWTLVGTPVISAR